MFFTNSQRKKAMDLLDELGKKPEETSGKNAEQYDKSDSSFFMPENKEAVTSLEADIEAEEEARAQEENGQQTLLPLLEKAQEDADDDEEEEEIEVITEDEKAKRTERYELLTGFMQHDANVISAGHYETDLHCCEMIGSHLLFPDEEVYALEPSCGSGAAMQTVCETGSVKAYGIELNRNYALEARQKDVFVDVLNDDAVANVRISKKTFGFCFANPPYGENPETHMRYETEFLRMVSSHLVDGGVLVWVVPRIIFRDLQHMGILFRRFEVEALFRFPEPEYSRFRQVVFILRKKELSGSDRVQYDNVRKRIIDLLGETGVDGLPILNWGKADILVPAGSAPKRFECDRFEYEKTIGLVYDKVAQTKTFDECVPFYDPTVVLHPPILPKTDSRYLLLTTMAIGSGVAGSKEDGTIHRVRGSMQRVNKDTHVVDEDGNETIVRRDYSTTKISIIDATGKLTELIPGKSAEQQMEEERKRGL